MGVSLDGYIAAPGGDISWSAPDAELHRFHNEQARELGVHLYGRRLWETMAPWETMGDEPGASPEVVEFAQIWRATPKLVFSTTLDRVDGSEARLVAEDPVEHVAALKRESGRDMGVGGAGLAASLIAAGLVDEYRLFVNPVVLGAGTPFFPNADAKIDLELAETRTFGSGVVYLRYRAG